MTDDVLPRPRPRALVWVADEADQCTAFNASWLAWRQQDLADECAVGWQASLHPGDVARVLPVHLQHLGSRTPYALECHAIGADGEPRLFLVAAGPWHQQDGVAGGFVGSFLDISDQAPSRRSATHVEAFYRATVEALDEGLLMNSGTSHPGVPANSTWVPLVGTGLGAALLRVAHYVDQHGPTAEEAGAHFGAEQLIHGITCRLSRAPRSGQRIAVARFRLAPVDAPRDRLGHTRAEDLMNVLAGRMSHTVRGGDVVTQLDDRTLAVVLDGVTSQENADGVAETIRASVCQPVRLAGETFAPEMTTTVQIIDPAGDFAGAVTALLGLVADREDS